MAAGAALFTVYLVTLAPGLTFWDSGELISAIHTLGIPHPPGTPLYILLGRAWSDVLGFLPRALATNMLSAAATAAACGMLAWMLAVSLRWNLAAFAAAVGAGTMSTVWLNATETEVYATSLLLASAMLCSAYRAGLTADPRWLVLTAYFFALAAPLHMSALVAAPAAIGLASYRGVGTTSWKNAALLTSAMGVAAGVGTASPVLTAAACIVLLACIAPEARDARSLSLLPVLALGISGLAYLPIRAAFDPAINSGNPETWSAVWDLVARRQYGHPGMWPRQAPIWLQFANPLEYVDWQIALGMAPGVAPSWVRTPFTMLFALLGVAGSVAHKRQDRRTWLGLLVLLLSSSVGLVLYMNFKAGASFGYGILPDDAPHEARDREYFFALAFWTWGAWAGIGAVQLTRRAGQATRWLGVTLALLPIVLNWEAVNRRPKPGSSLPRVYGEALLWSVPNGGILITGGDNDSFPLWFLQTVEGMRPDVSVVVAPLLGAPWYRAQLERRDSLLPRSPIERGRPNRDSLLMTISGSAESQGRPVVSAISAGRARRVAIGGSVLYGLAWHPERSASLQHIVWQDELGGYVDTLASKAFEARFLRHPLGGTLKRRLADPAALHVLRLLSCPIVAMPPQLPAEFSSLDSACNLR